MVSQIASKRNHSHLEASIINYLHINKNLGCNWVQFSSRNNDQVHINYGQCVLNLKNVKVDRKTQLAYFSNLLKMKMLRSKVQKISHLVNGFMMIFV
ncbi:hypothetical protein BFX31_13225 [Vibrio paracholerae]|nr:hypothetical protein BFX31_13225 [Vibrio paracholerae]